MEDYEMYGKEDEFTEENDTSAEGEETEDDTL